MGFFQDDFYSTKPTRRLEKRRFSGLDKTRRAKGGNSRLLLLVLILVILAIMIIGLGHRSGGPASSGTAREAKAFEAQVMKVAGVLHPEVVSVISTYSAKSGDASGSNNAQSSTGMSLGSGVVFQITGHTARIVTNNHVVAGSDHVEVVFSDGTKRTAKIAGTDVMSDLAVLNVDAAGETNYAKFGDSDRLKAGQTAIAIGNPLGLGESVTVGVISSPHRIVPVPIGSGGSQGIDIDLIQTDAAINAGNSGGALVNLDGQVIGINSRKVEASGVEGLGFAIPINQVKPVVDSLIRYGKVNRPMIGIYSEDLSAYTGDKSKLKLPPKLNAGIVVLKVVDPAKSAGLRQGDVIVKLDSDPIGSTFELRRFLYTHKHVGDNVDVAFYRQGVLKHVRVKLKRLNNG